MLLPNGLLCCPFTCVDAGGAPSAPAATPTAVLVKNGVDMAVAVNVVMSGASGVASCSIPAIASPGDCWHLRISSLGYSQCSPVYLTGPGVLTPAYDAAKTAAAPGSAMTLTSTERTTLAGAIESSFLDDETGGAFLAGIQSQIQAILDNNTDVPVSTLSNAIAAAVHASLASELSRLDVPVSSRLAGTDYVSSPSEEVIASAILQDPSYKLLTTAGGLVTCTNGGTGGGGGLSFVLPLRATTTERLVQNRIDLFTSERCPLVIPILDANRQPVDCTGMICTLHTSNGIEISNLAPAPSAPDGIPHCYEFTPPAGLTAAAASLRYSLRVNNSTQQVLAYGQLVVTAVP